MIDKIRLMELAERYAESYNDVKTRLFVKVLNANNRFGGEDIVHTDFEDLSLLYYVLLVEEEKQQAGLVVTGGLLEEWGVTQEMLHDDAMENSMRLFPERIFNLGEYFGFFGMTPMYVVTNKNGDEGAVALFYPGVVEKLYDLIGDFVVLPSSTDEVIVAPDDGNYERCARLVAVSNKMMLPKESRLSDHIYCYRRSENKLRMVL